MHNDSPEDLGTKPFDAAQKGVLVFFFVYIALFLHFLILILFYLVPKKYWEFSASTPEEQVVWVENIPPPVDVAAIDPPSEEKRPEKARHAGEYNSSVKEERVAPSRPMSPSRPSAPRRRVSKSVSAPQPKSPSPEPRAIERPAQKPISPREVPRKPPSRIREPEEPTERTEKPEPQPQRTASREPPPRKEPPFERKPEKPREKPSLLEPPSRPSLNNYKLRPEDISPNLMRPPSEKKPSLPPLASRSGEPRASSSPNLNFRSFGSGLSYGRGASAPQEYYPDYTLGGKTYLNVMKMQDVGYFARMKRILRMRWNPIPSVREYLMSTKSARQKIDCVIGVGLDESGRIKELLVIRSSGVGAYDREALQTIRDSSPFSSPPANYLKEGILRMSWTFIVYL